MTWSYTAPVDGAYANPRDEVRFHLRDTVQHPWSLDDAELDWLIAQWREQNSAPAPEPVDTYTVASWAADSIADGFTETTGTSWSKSVDDVSLSGSTGDRVGAWRAFAARLLGRGKSGGAVYRGMGLAASGSAALRPVFALRQMDNGAGGDPRPSLSGQDPFYAG